jgi:hypothetical protein
MRLLDEAIQKPEAAGTGAYIEVVTEADERLRINEKDLPGGRAMPIYLPLDHRSPRRTAVGDPVRTAGGALFQFTIPAD